MKRINARQLPPLLPSLQEQALNRLIPLLRRLPVSHVLDLAEAMEKHGNQWRSRLKRSGPPRAWDEQLWSLAQHGIRGAFERYKRRKFKR